MPRLSCHVSARTTILCLSAVWTDLTALIQIHDRALWHYRQAIAELKVEDYPGAQIQIQQALALDGRQAIFYTLAGQISALQGEWQLAITTWKQAQRLDPTNPIALQCLQLLSAVAQQN
ncbi:hypothetical protein [Stenomitos frigidus]|uniref:hypothetical protein n=1 Tax=Stenomitos frigidus TaxID=1886765 RepID=UPI002678D31A